MIHRRLLLLVGTTLLLAGCMTVSSTLTLRSDGTGTITERLTFNPETARMMRAMESAFDSTGTAQDLFSEAEIEAKADSLSGIRLDSFTRIDDETGEGYEAVYAFDDLNEIQFDPSPAAGVADDAEGVPSEGPFDLLSAMAVTFSPGTPATLTVRMPRDTLREGEDDTETDTLSVPEVEDDSPPSEEELKMVRALMKGAGFRVAVTVDGTIVETNATHRTGSTITLVAMDFGTLAQDSTAFRTIMADEWEPDSPEAAIDRLNTFPGVTIEPQETVTIRFH